MLIGHRYRAIAIVIAIGIAIVHRYRDRLLSGMPESVSLSGFAIVIAFAIAIASLRHSYREISSSRYLSCYWDRCRQCYVITYRLLLIVIACSRDCYHIAIEFAIVSLSSSLS
ncbi:hypothetical protein Tco_1483001 [Tanacetum coccineum]